MTVPLMYRKEAHLLEVIALEHQLLRAGYPFEVIRNMPLPEARLKGAVMGMLYG